MVPLTDVPLLASASSTSVVPSTATVTVRVTATLPAGPAGSSFSAAVASAAGAGASPPAAASPTWNSSTAMLAWFSSDVRSRADREAGSGVPADTNTAMPPAASLRQMSAAAHCRAVSGASSSEATSRKRAAWCAAPSANTSFPATVAFTTSRPSNIMDTTFPTFGGMLAPPARITWVMSSVPRPHDSSTDMIRPPHLRYTELTVDSTLLRVSLSEKSTPSKSDSTKSVAVDAVDSVCFASAAAAASLAMAFGWSEISILCAFLNSLMKSFINAASQAAPPTLESEAEPTTASAPPRDCTTVTVVRLAPMSKTSTVSSFAGPCPIPSPSAAATGSGMHCFTAKPACFAQSTSAAVCSAEHPIGTASTASVASGEAVRAVCHSRCSNIVHSSLGETAPSWFCTSNATMPSAFTVLHV
mmetsp:Transcript_36265/g.95016  ORF Transcript_36265/g.95016 Transcript_36265/m.95016 type:complete len:416 (-) Transcript_36265:291-1538(-)